MKQNRKDNFIIVRVTKEEKDKLVIDSKKRMFTITEWVRKIMGLDK